MVGFDEGIRSTISWRIGGGGEGSGVNFAEANKEEQRLGTPDERRWSEIAIRAWKRKFGI